MNKNESLLNSKLKWVQRLSTLLDSQFKIPGTRFRFGLDPVLNLIPFAGNLPGTLMSVALFLTMLKYGVSRKVIILMLLNVVVDALIGSIPVLGQAFDFFFKANDRNISLLKKHYEERKYQGSGTGIIVIVVLVLAAFFTLFIYLIWKISEWILNIF
ncbi:DUF4112 domain-containing protein [Rubrolithibacter danxiaensis]|uniref:DUF4112 domain-containing protein n=1 Tax=Rubrolithibacter danxiaensis TaxID=3390805 RepID=UPI003BF7A8AC